jgi:hypothetical protein
MEKCIFVVVTFLSVQIIRFSGIDYWFDTMTGLWYPNTLKCTVVEITLPEK